ncbi:hypothetical protein LY474_17325 [Myxococcus stipitatus]|nr:hypothetical protein [Myxococcus stipitatus]MCE9669559.1 hypothetical protein [Myxococcus stipitatus]
MRFDRKFINARWVALAVLASGVKGPRAMTGSSPSLAFPVKTASRM